MSSAVTLYGDDLDALIEAQSFLPDEDRWSDGSLQLQLNYPHRISMGVWQDARLVAFLLAGWVCDEAELYQIATMPEVRNQGLAKLLMAELSRALHQLDVTRLMLEVRQSNRPAQQLYQSIGFVQDGLRKGYYPCQNGGVEDALLLSYKISA